jgi:DNA-binding transcriptional ArsR family regulator
MPQAKKPAPRPSRPPGAFREPAALRRMSGSIDAAQDALAQLRKDAGRDVSQGTRELYKDLRTFLSSAGRDTGRLAKALQRDFAQAQKRLGGPGSSPRPARASAPAGARGVRSGTAERQPRRARTPARAGATAPSPARSAAPGRSPTRPAGAARGAILEALAGGQAMTATQVAAATGLGRGTVSTTLSRLRRAGEITKAPRGYQVARERATADETRADSSEAEPAASPGAGAGPDESSA